MASPRKTWKEILQTEGGGGETSHDSQTLVWFLTFLQMIQIFQQQLEELLHLHQSLEGHGVTEDLPHRRHFGLLLLAVVLPPLIEVTRQGGDFGFDLRDAAKAVRNQVVVTLQGGHNRGGSLQLVGVGGEVVILFEKASLVTRLPITNQRRA